MTTVMRTRDDVLREINAELPSGIDWRRGAMDFVAAWSSNVGEHQARRIQLTTPLRPADAAARWSLAETTQYLYNFTNTLEILQLAPGARILDVACGGGWFSHYLTRCGYDTFGFDISEEFIDFAKQRITEDPYLDKNPTDMFIVRDIEAQSLPSHFDAVFDGAVLESCLHHFYDPVAALTNIATAMKPTGVVVIIEGENRQGPIKPEWIEEMRRYQALERPYPRALLAEVLALAGLPAFEFVGQVNGWFSPDAPEVRDLHAYFRAGYVGRNHLVAAKSEEALRRVFPSRQIPTGRLRFGRGFYPEHNGWRWAAPQAEIDVLSTGPATLRFLAHGPALTSNQTVSLFSHRHGPCGQVTLSAVKTSDVLTIHAHVGDTITLCSDFVFSPAWSGESDHRLLSYAIAPA